ncbi:MAG: efflux RND transporter periplasmic adaptor subunit [Armatimonadota bacterium]
MKQSVKIWIIRFIIIGIIAGSAYQWGIPLYKHYLTPPDKNLKVPTAVAKEGVFKVSFHVNGTLEAKVSVPVRSTMRGKIIKLVDEGAFVKAGDLIARLDTEETERTVRNEKLKYENMMAELNRIKGQLEILKEQNKTELVRVQTRLDFDKAELNRVTERRDRKLSLAREKIIASDEVESAERDVRAKQLIVTKGEMNLEMKRKEVLARENQTIEDMKNVEIVSNMAKTELEEAEAKMKKAVILAPAAGMVVLTKVRDDAAGGRRAIREGDNVSPRRSICNLPDLSTMLIKVQVSEATSPRVFVDMPVLFKLEAVLNKVFHGVVSNIANLATIEDPRTGTVRTTGARTFTVTVAITEKDPKTLKPGMTADVEFLEKSIDKAVYVPKNAIIEKNGITTVFKKDGKSFVNVPVETGSFNDTSVCIMKGVKKNDVVALRDPTRNEEEEITSLGTGENSDNGNK